MKTGKQTVSLDGESITFKFKTSSTKKGQGFTEIDDKKLYIGGKLIKADKDDKYMIANFELNDDGSYSYEEVSVKDLIKDEVSEDKDKNYKYTINDNYKLSLIHICILY